MLILRLIILTFIICIIWQGVVYIFKLPFYILPDPFQVFKTWFLQFNLIINHLVPTLVETVVGLLLGILFGMYLALCMAFSSVIRYWFLPLIVMSQAIPTFAIAPLLVLWFGYGMASKIVTTILMLFFPVASYFFDGLMSTAPEWVDMAKIMNGKRLSVLLHLRFPAALPQLASGIRVASVFAPIGAIVSEWIGSSQGLGFLMLNANARLETDLMFACIITIMMMALLLYGLVTIILKKLIPWM